MQPITAKMLVIAVDGLDWQMLQRLIDNGSMPYCQQLVEKGASGKMLIPPPHASAAAWTTVATGCLADQHGVCHDLEVRDDGITVQAASSTRAKQASFWQAAMGAGKTVRVAGWPATNPATIPEQAGAGSCIVGNGVEVSQPGGEQYWLLPPDAVAPRNQRHIIKELRVYPNDLSSEMVISLLSQSCQDAGLLNEAAGLLAAVSTIHNIGTLWAEANDWDLITLRFDFLPRWLLACGQHSIPPHEALAPWYQYLDLLVGRYMALVGRDNHLLVVSDHGLALQSNSQADNLLGLRSAGCMLMAGPDVPQDRLLSNINGVDICPTILGLLAIAPGQTLVGRTLFSANQLKPQANSPTLQSAPDDKPLHQQWFGLIPTVELGMAWLLHQGVTKIDLSNFTAQVDKIRAESLAAWAALQHVKGNHDEGIKALTYALDLQPDNLLIRFSLAEKLFSLGRAEECQLLVEALPAGSQLGQWQDVINSLLAIVKKDWITAEALLHRLSCREHSPINAFGWLGHIQYQQENWAAAKQHYHAATSGPGDISLFYQRLGLTLMQLEEHQAALVAFDEAVARQPMNARFLANRAMAYEALGEVQSAQQDLWQALRIAPASRSVQRQLHALLSAVGQAR